MRRTRYKYKLGKDEHGEYAILTIKRLRVCIDADQLDMILKHAWHFSAGGYAKTTIHGRRVSMHALLLPAPPGLMVDHVDQNKLNNRLYNLRVAEHRQNVVNGKRRKRQGRSKYPYYGIGKSHGKWMAKIGYKHRDFTCAKFDFAWEAGVAYDIMAALFNGEYAALNFPADDPRIPAVRAKLPMAYLIGEKARIDALPNPPKPRYRGVYIASLEPTRYSFDFQLHGERQRGKTYKTEEEAVVAMNQRYLELSAPHKVQALKADVTAPDISGPDAA